jgi:hypothetical protein
VTFGSVPDWEARLPFTSGRPRGRPFGARSDEAVFIGDVLTRHVPEIASRELEIVAIARRPGELSRSRFGAV